MKYGSITPRDYQREAHQATAEWIRNYKGPAIIDASVGAGKSLLIAMICHRAQEVNWKVLVLSRQGEIQEQNAEAAWECGVKNSLFSASLGIKSTAYPIIFGTEGTVANALDKELSDFVPNLLLIDEAHHLDYFDPDTQYMKIIAEMQRRNPQLRIFGYTGSPYRGTEPILGTFWQKRIYQISTETLVDRGFLVPCVFGVGDDEIKYDLSQFAGEYNDGAKEFTAAELKAMEKEILNQGTRTQRIMLEVMHLTKDRNGVMITGASKRHLGECAKYLPPNSYGIITDSTPNKQRRETLHAIKDGKLKYVLQVGCLTTGFDAPIIDTCVILRKIGSLTLLVQLIGRSLRILKPAQVESGLVKNDALVLDYSDTMYELGQLYHNPILEQAEAQRGKMAGDVITCPKCYTENSMFARRCIAEDDLSPDNRCEHFWQSRPCPTCGTENDIAARECRKCETILLDPNDNLLGKHYTDEDLKPVLRWDIRLTKNAEGIVVDYYLPEGEKATEIFYPKSDNRTAVMLWRTKFVQRHINCPSWQRKVLGMRTAAEVVRMAAAFDKPTHITHRINDKKRSIIHRKVFNSGREEVEQDS